MRVGPEMRKAVPNSFFWKRCSVTVRVGAFCHSWFSPLGLGFCAESAHEPLPVGETG